MSSGSFINSYVPMGLFNLKLKMSAHMNFTFCIERTVLKMSLDVVRYAVVLVTLPGKLIRLSPTVGFSWDVFPIFVVVFQPQFFHRWLSCLTEISHLV